MIDFKHKQLILFELEKIVIYPALMHLCNILQTKKLPSY